MKKKSTEEDKHGNREGEDKNLLDTLIVKYLMQNIQPVSKQ